MKNHIKVGIILIGVLLIYGILIYIIAAKRVAKENEKKEPDSGITENPTLPLEEEVMNGDLNILITPRTVVSYKNGIWQENPKFKHQNIPFDVYVGNNVYKEHYISYDSNWHIFDASKNFIDYEGDFIAINANKEYNNINFVTSQLNENDKNNIITYLTNKGLSFNYDALSKSKIIFDINKDGIRDEIYFVSNAFSDDVTNNNKAFTIGFIKYYHKSEQFLEVIENLDNIYSIHNSYLKNILEVDGQIYFIVGNQYFSDNGTYHTIYVYTDTSLIEVLKTSTKN